MSNDFDAWLADKILSEQKKSEIYQEIRLPIPSMEYEEEIVVETISSVLVIENAL